MFLQSRAVPINSFMFIGLSIINYPFLGYQGTIMAGNPTTATCKATGQVMGIQKDQGASNTSTPGDPNYSSWE